MSPMRDGTGQTTSEDRATQLLIWETLSLAIVKNGLVWYSWFGLDGSEFTAIYQSLTQVGISLLG